MSPPKAGSAISAKRFRNLWKTDRSSPYEGGVVFGLLSNLFNNLLVGRLCCQSKGNIEPSDCQKVIADDLAVQLVFTVLASLEVNLALATRTS